MEHSQKMSLMAALLVAVIGVFGIFATVASNNATGASIRIVETRDYLPFAEQMCPDPALPVPVFEQKSNRYGNMMSQFVECIAADDTVDSDRVTFRPSRNRNGESTSAFADHFTRPSQGYRMLYQW